MWSLIIKVKFLLLTILPKRNSANLVNVIFMCAITIFSLKVFTFKVLLASRCKVPRIPFFQTMARESGILNQGITRYGYKTAFCCMTKGKHSPKKAKFCEREKIKKRARGRGDQPDIISLIQKC